MLGPLGSCVQGVIGKLCLPKCVREFKQAPGIWFIQGSYKLCLAWVYVCLGAWCLFVGTKSLFSRVAAETQRWYKLNWINFRHLKKKAVNKRHQSVLQEQSPSHAASCAPSFPFPCSWLWAGRVGKYLNPHYISLWAVPHVSTQTVLVLVCSRLIYSEYI